MKSSTAEGLLHGLPSIIFLGRDVGAFPKPLLHFEAFVLNPCLADVLPHQVRLLCLDHEVSLGSNDIRRAAQVTAVWIVGITPRVSRRIDGSVHRISILGMNFWGNGRKD